MQRTKSFFPNRNNIAEMDLKIFAIWGIWDTILTAIIVYIFWLYSKIYGNTNRSVFISGTVVWIAVFVIFWVATANMGLSSWSILLITLPLSWFELIVGSYIASKLYKKLNLT
jgi:energy-coupling factor transporter transmembrane protein EcfT